jgi:hypothetical protein
MKKIDYNKHIWEGWIVQNFIDALSPTLDMIQNNKSWMKAINTKAELKEWCKDNQPYYKKHIPEVVNHFAEKFNLK